MNTTKENDANLDVDMSLLEHVTDNRDHEGQQQGSSQSFHYPIDNYLGINYPQEGGYDCQGQPPPYPFFHPGSPPMFPGHGSPQMFPHGSPEPHFFNPQMMQHPDPMAYLPFPFSYYEALQRKKRRRRLGSDETKILVDVFDKNPKPSASVRDALAKKLKMTPRAIQIWFQNRRAKMKRDGSDNSSGLTFTQLSSPQSSSEASMSSSINSAKSPSSAFRYEVQVIDNMGHCQDQYQDNIVQDQQNEQFMIHNPARLQDNLIPRNRLQETLIMPQRNLVQENRMTQPFSSPFMSDFPAAHQASTHACKTEAVKYAEDVDLGLFFQPNSDYFNSDAAFQILDNTMPISPQSLDDFIDLSK